jgi:hypothetical protein
MRQLHAGDTALLMNETDNPSQRFNVSVAPDTKVLRTDAAIGRMTRCLSKPGRRRPLRCQMDECQSLAYPSRLEYRTWANEDTIRKLRSRIVRIKGEP